MAKRDYYDILGVQRSATEAELKKAYRRLAMKYHPDRNEGDAQAEERFKEAKEAFEILGDAQKRQAYDQFGHAGVDPAMHGGAGAAGGASFSDIFGDVFGDIFGNATAGGRRGSRVHRGADLQYNLEVTLEQAVAGTTAKVRVPSWVICEICGGNGAKKGTQPGACNTCGGIGQIRMQQGFFSVQQTCPTCRGSGQVISDPCGNCRGRGRVQETRTLSVKIPPGVDSGDRIRLAGEGEAGDRGGPAGDLFVVISVKPHELFERDGSDLLCEVPINVVAAALGGEREIPTLDGRVKLKIPAGTQTGKIFRMRGKGVRPIRGSVPGDMLCRVRVETPVNLTAEQRELLSQLGASIERSSRRHSPEEGSWLEGVKKFFDGMMS